MADGILIRLISQNLKYLAVAEEGLFTERLVNTASALHAAVMGVSCQFGELHGFLMNKANEANHVANILIFTVKKSWNGWA